MIELDSYYSLQPILLFVNMGISITKICLDTFVLAKSNMDRRKYKIYYKIQIIKW
jgi:hypothetical protein